MNWFNSTEKKPKEDIEVIGIVNDKYYFVVYHNGYFWNRNKEIVSVVEWAYVER